MSEPIVGCPYCKHRRVCAVYDTSMNADIKAGDFNTLNPGCDDKVYEVLAQNCSEWDLVWK